MGDVRSGCCTYSLTTTISGNLIFLLVVFYFTSTCVCFIYCTINVHIKATTELSFILITQRYIYLYYINKKNPPNFSDGFSLISRFRISSFCFCCFFSCWSFFCCFCVFSCFCCCSFCSFLC